MDLKKIFEKIIPGSLSVDTRRVSTENAPEGDSKENFKALDKTFEIAFICKIYTFPAKKSIEKQKK